MTGGEFAYRPSLDGVRGLAVAMVLVFHAGFDWLPGGYVGVSVFFTLSGYLITSLALVEHDRTRRLDVGAFYGRRLRRLLPASLLCLAAVVAMGWQGWFLDDEHLRRDALGALFQVANWVDLTSGQSYADFATGSGAPLDHYWSLAIEEQFYWVWPLALLGVLRLRAGGRVVALAALFGAAVVAAPVIAWTAGPDAAYWATPARLGELLVGALLAVVLHRRPAVPRAAAVLAPVGLGVIVWAAVTWPSGRGPAYAGWLPVFALASVALLVGLQAASPLRRAFEVRPLVALGVISYGVYLFHWPIFLAVDDRTGLAPWPLFSVRVAITLAAATASFLLLERPVRRSAVALRPTLRFAALGAAAVTAIVVAVPVGERLATSSVDGVARAGPPPTLELAVVASTTSTTTTTTTTGPARSAARATTTTVTTAAPTTTVAPTTTTTDPLAVPLLPAGPVTRPVRILVVGDSTAEAAGYGLVEWARDHPDLAEVTVVAAPSCGFVRGAPMEEPPEDDFLDGCDDLHGRRLPEALADVQPDVVVNLATITDVVNHVWSDEEGPLGLDDERFSVRLLHEYTAMSQRLIDTGVSTVVWIAPPRPDLPYTGALHVQLSPERFVRYRSLLTGLDGALDGRVEVVDLGSWMAAQAAPPERDDGVHWSRAGARDLAERFLAPFVLTLALS